MNVLFVINASILDQGLLDEYRAAAKPSMAKYGVRMLAGANDAEIIEGEPFGRGSWSSSSRAARPSTPGMPTPSTPGRWQCD